MKWIVRIACGLALVAIPAAAQEVILKELATLHERCTATDFALDAEEAGRIRGSLDVWRLNPDELDPLPRRHLLTLEVCIALGRGDAATARTAYERLAATVDADAGTQRIAYLVACANGDAQLGEAALRALSRLVESDQRRRISRMRRCMRQVGGEAPDVSIRLADLSEINPSSPDDGAIVLHFWKVDDARDQSPKPLADLAKRIGELDGVRLIGVNSDAEDDFQDARAFATRVGYDWPQRYEGVARNAPVTDQAFRVGRPGWLVVVDEYGYVRAVGDPDDPGIAYAAQAAAAEAEDTYPRVLATARDGSRPSAPSQETGTGTASSGHRQASGGGAGDLPSDPEAEALFRRARLAMRTGQRNSAKDLLREVISKYPDTEQARKARELLDSLP